MTHSHLLAALRSGDRLSVSMLRRILTACGQDLILTVHPKEPT